MSFSYIDFPLESESAFWVLDDLRLVLSFDKLSLSSYDLQLEKERYETWVIFLKKLYLFQLMMIYDMLTLDAEDDSY